MRPTACSAASAASARSKERPVARKIEPPQTKPASSQTDGADDWAILYPQRTATIAGREITIREYSFAESFEIYALAQPLLADLTDAAALAGDVSWNVVMGVLARHGAVVMELVSRAAD